MILPPVLSRLSPTTWVTIQTVYTQLFGIGVFAFQAPMLGPRAFGLFAIVMVFISLCDSLLDTSIDVLISMPQIEPLHYATMNGFAALFAAGLGLTLASVAGPIASGFGVPQLAAVIQVMAVLPLVTALGATPNAETKRRMEFKPLAIRMISGVTLGGLVGLFLTFAGAGVWALVGQTFVQRVIGVAVLWRNSTLPLQFSASRQHWRDLAGFTWPLLLSRAMIWTSSQLPRCVLALHLTVTELGLYSLAARLADISVQMTVVPSAAVARVQLRQYAADSAGLNVVAGAFLSRMSALCFPVCFVGAALMPTLIHAWLTSKWFDAIIPAQVLLLASATWVTFYAGGVLFLALNQQRSEALSSILQTVTILLTVVIFGAYGLIVVAIALAIRPVLLLPVETTLVQMRCRVPARVFLSSQGPALWAAAGSGLVLLFVRDSIDSTLGSRLALVTLAAAGLAIYLMLLTIMAPQTLRQLLKPASEGKSRTASPPPRDL
jgi:O-antigen/teichoic acid export membrane protein